MKTIDKLRSILDQQSQLIRKIRPNLDWKYGGFEELVLDCGFEMNLAPLPLNIKRGLPRNCYYNCFKLLNNNFALTYCKGYGLIPHLPLPFIHAWLVDHNGKVIDPTWGGGKKRLSSNQRSGEKLSEDVPERRQLEFICIRS